MVRFNPPPGWPAPAPAWRPHAQWQPDPTWPAPPPGWGFWVDEQGRAVDGPHGLYGARRRPLGRRVGLFAGVGMLMLLSSCVGAVAGSSGSPEPTATERAAFAARPSEAAPSPSTTTVTETSTSTQTVTSTVTAPPATQTVTSTVTVDSGTRSTGSSGVSGSTARSTSTSGGSGAVSYPNCDAVRAAGKAPIRRGEPGYAPKLDRDGDGIACDTEG